MLKELQSNFQNYCLQDDRTIEAEIVEQGKLTVQERLAIYGEGYFLRLIEVLAEQFKCLKHLMSGEEFDRMAKAYILVHPSVYFTVRYVGRHLEKYLANTMPYQENLLYSEMAAFEYTFAAAFDAADAPVISLNELLAVPPENWGSLKFKFHPSVHYLKTHWNVNPQWGAFDSNKPLPKTHHEEVEQWSLLWRRDVRVNFCLIPELEIQALIGAMQGDNFADICEALCEKMDEEIAPEFAATLLARWLNDGLITELST